MRARRGPLDFANDEVLSDLDVALSHLQSADEGLLASAGFAQALEALASADAHLRGRHGLRALALDAELRDQLAARFRRLEELRGEAERQLERDGTILSPEELERAAAGLRDFADRLWSLRVDRLGAAQEVRELAGPEPTDPLVDGLWAIQLALSAVDRLEVRGRDSAGLYVLVRDHGVDLEARDLRDSLAERRQRSLLPGGAVRTPEGALAFVYKTAQEIGELGDNVRALRRQIRDDELLRRALSGPESEVVVLAHTRWASVGMISEPNAHPVNAEEAGAVDRSARAAGIVAALNGDVDNHLELRERYALDLDAEITTDAKVIPVLVERELVGGAAADEAFRRTVASFEGSVAIGLSMPQTPDRLYLALRGSGQALYVGIADGAYVVASEPYGLVEITDRYLRLDGETAANPASPDASRGQIVVLEAARAGTLEGIGRRAYDGTPLPVSDSELGRLEITTLDVERGEYPHFLLKEISESPRSFRKTLRGKIRTGDDGPRVTLGSSTLPEGLLADLGEGAVRRIWVIGQGTAAVAGTGVARALEELLPRSIQVRAMPATELSGFALEDRMEDSLVVAISQSGTTTDTNRTVDLARSRGARVISIVNRRHSDLTDKSDGVLYTSDGRDVEMSVASTKAFYSQIAAGFLLAAALAEAAPGDDAERADRRRRVATLLRGLEQLPEAMESCLGYSEDIAGIAERHVGRHRYWALVGNGWNRIAAEEIRIKLSELCYKSIACDATEDKKHIDLSSEPLILVCAAGLSGSTAGDVAKEVAIYRAHKATPIVIATEGEARFGEAVELVRVPRAHPALAFVLATVVGHLFGYHAALAIDRSARPLRQMRAAIDRVVAETDADRPDGPDPLERLRAKIGEPIGEFFGSLAKRSYDGHLEASTAVELATLLRLVGGALPLSLYSSLTGRAGTPGVVLAHLVDATTRAIDELTRPIDAIKHQAKTVTVGISRTDEALMTVRLVRAVLDAGVERDALTYEDLKTLAALDPLVERVAGFTRYRLEGDPVSDESSIRVVERGGVARELRSRVEDNRQLRGTKRTMATEGRLLVSRGRSDQRTVILVPELLAGQVVGLVLLHVDYVDTAEPGVLRGALDGYRHRWSLLRDAVMETEPVFDEELVAELPVESLLCDSIQQLAEQLRQAHGAATTVGDET